MVKAILFDATKCVGCRGCQVACKRWNELEAEITEMGATFTNPPDLSPHTWIYMNFMEDIAESPEDVRISWEFTRRSCMHCVDPACASVCPTQAITKLSEGPVTIDQDRCMGCKYCMQACPFDVPRFDEEMGKVFKCTMCADRIGVDEPPSCVKSCVAGALSFGDRETMLATAKVQAAKTNGIIYGEKEAAGTNVFYILPRPAAELGLRVPPMESAGAFWRSLLTKISAIGIAGAAAFVLLGFIISRRVELMEKKEV